MLDATDCGGRLGPHLEGGNPDLANLSVSSISTTIGLPSSSTPFLVLKGILSFWLLMECMII
jgi:hypothetical protein